MNIPKLEDLNAASCREKAIQNKYPEFYNFLIEKYKDYTWPEKMALYYHHLDKPPVCSVCGKPTKFVNMGVGWRKTCSYKCAGKDNDTKMKKEKTLMSNYGVKNPAQSEIILNRIKSTCLEKYGTTNGGWSKDAQVKIKQTNLKKYGVEHPMSSPDIRKKSEQTCVKKYGVTCTGRVKNGVTVFDKYPNLLMIKGNNIWNIKCSNKHCDKCNEKKFDIDSSLYVGRLKCNAEPCPILNPIHSLYSSLELIVRGWLNEWGIKYETNKRDIIPPQELDIYIPDKKIAIEINGCYWHSDMEKPKDYHINKFRDCRDKGIQLIQIWEDWMVNKEEIVKSFLQSKLGICNNVIYARKCMVKEIDYRTAMTFLEQNHIQGKCSSNYRLGLYNGDILVAVMCFNKRSGLSGSKVINDSEIELIRFCNLRDHRVIGGASKLLKYYIKTFRPKLVTSYSANDISNGQLYKSLGFTSDYKISGAYWYIEPVTFRRLHRSIFTRAGIVKRWPEFDINDKGWTERLVMNSKGYIRIYDAGTTRWILTLA